MSNYWDEGPPTAIYEGLVSSGLVKNPNLLPQIPQNQSQMRMPMKKPIPFSKTMNQPMIKSKSPIPAGASALSLSKPAQFAYLNKSTPQNNKRASIDISNTKRFALPPETRAVAVPTFDRIPKTQHCTRAESQSMLKDHNDRIEKVSVSDYGQLTANEQFKTEKMQLYSYLLSFNEAITKVKTYNSDIALILVKVKNYFQSLYEKIPQICEKYESEINLVRESEQKTREENEKLRIENNDHLSSQEYYNRDINKLKEQAESLENKLKENEDARSELEYQAVNLRQKIDDLTYRLTKSDELRQQYQSRLVSSEEQIDVLTKQQSESNKLIASLKEAQEGTSEDFATVRAELESTKKELESAKARLEYYSKYEAARSDIGTDPIGIKRKRGSRRGSLSTDFFSSSGEFSLASSAELVSLQGDDEGRIHLATIHEDHRHRHPAIHEELSVGSLGFPSEPPSPDKSSEKSPTKQKATEERLEENNTAEQNSKSTEKLISENQNSEISTSENQNTETESVKERKVIVKHKQVETKEGDRLMPNDYTIIEEVTIEDGAIPEGYVLVELEEAPTVTSCVDQLFTIQVPQAPPTRNYDRRSDEVKPFSWTLRQAIDILQEGAGQPMSTSHSFGDVVSHVLLRDFKTEKIARRVEAALWHSVHTYRPGSQALQFFVDMAGDAYNILDFRFFSVVLSLAFQHIYPSVDQILRDPDLITDSGLFLIHASYVERIAEITLRTSKLSEEATALLDRPPPEPRYPRMVSFWDAARALIAEFRATHARFNLTVRNALVCVGWTESNFVCRQHFLGVVRLLRPGQKIAAGVRMWDNALIANNSSNPDTITHDVFMRTIGETKGLAQDVLALPLCANYEARLSSLGEALFNLFFFLRTRFTDFVPALAEALPVDIAARLSSAVVRMRNGLMWADVASALLYYRTMLQHTDLRMTELSPITQFGLSVTANDIGRVINHLKMRECLATLLVNGEDTSEETLSEHAELLVNV